MAVVVFRIVTAVKKGVGTRPTIAKKPPTRSDSGKEALAPVRGDSTIGPHRELTKMRRCGPSLPGPNQLPGGPGRGIKRADDK